MTQELLTENIALKQKVSELELEIKQLKQLKEFRQKEEKDREKLLKSFTKEKIEKLKSKETAYTIKVTQEK